MLAVGLFFGPRWTDITGRPETAGGVRVPTATTPLSNHAQTTRALRGTWGRLAQIQQIVPRQEMLNTFSQILANSPRVHTKCNLILNTHNGGTMTGRHSDYLATLREAARCSRWTSSSSSYYTVCLALMELKFRFHPQPRKVRSLG